MLALLNPWRQAKLLQQEVDKRDLEIEAVRRHLDLMADRYDKIREMNTQLRETLALYRNGL